MAVPVVWRLINLLAFIEPKQHAEAHRPPSSKPVRTNWNASPLGKVKMPATPETKPARPLKLLSLDPIQNSLSQI
jgi:hypothetical protein